MRTCAVIAIFIFCALGGLLFGWDIGKRAKKGRESRHEQWFDLEFDTPCCQVRRPMS
jgi:hypothetical protein